MNPELLSLLSCGIALTLSHCSTGYAANNVCTEGFGTIRCSEGEIPSLSYLGNAILSGTHVLGNLTVTGNLQATNAEIGSANLTGNVNVSHLIVHNHFNAIGI